VSEEDLLDLAVPMLVDAEFAVDEAAATKVAAAGGGGTSRPPLFEFAGEALPTYPGGGGMKMTLPPAATKVVGTLWGRLQGGGGGGGGAAGPARAAREEDAGPKLLGKQVSGRSCSGQFPSVL
jgi:hypothetical protein